MGSHSMSDDILEGIRIYEGQQLIQYPSFFAVVETDTGEIYETCTIH